MERVLYHHRTQGRRVEAVHILGISDGLRELGYEVEIVGPPGVEVDPDAPTPPRAGGHGPSWEPIARHAPQLLFELMGLAYNLTAVPRLWARCRGERPSFIYERYAAWNTAGVLVGRLLRIPVVLEVNDTITGDRLRHGKQTVMRGFGAFIERLIFHNTRAIITVSAPLRETVIAAGVVPDRVRVLPNAVDPRRFDPDRADGSRVRRQYGLEGKTVIGFTGSFSRWHGLGDLVEAFARIAPKFPDTRLLLVGDGAERPLVEELTTRLGVQDRVVITGKVPHSEIPEHVAAMDVCVASGVNSFVSPVKVFEYMAMGRATLSAGHPPMAAVIRHGISGLLFPPGDVEMLAGALHLLATDEALRAKLGAAGRAQVLAEHLWVHNARRTVELFQSAHDQRSEATTHLCHQKSG